MDQSPLTPDEVDEALQQAMRREAATREETPDNEQIFDSANQEGMGHRGAGQGRHTGRKN
jgi:hypothetical protein